MRVLPLAALLCGSWLSLPALATTDASQWLDRIDRAEQQRTFQGTFVYERSGSFSTHAIWHRASAGHVVERVLQLDGLPQEVLRNDGHTQCSSAAPEGGVSTAGGNARLYDALKLMSWYDLKVAGDSRVAGRAAVVLSLTPKDRDRYALELHLDRETGLPLKSLLLNASGQLLERFQFTRFVTEAPAEGDLRPSGGCLAVTANPSSAPVAVPWRADWLPPGFEVISSGSQQDEHGTRVDRMLFDDGLAKFSVFIEPVKTPDATDGRTQLGPTAAVSRRLNTAQGDVMVTVVGEIPMGTAERIALSIRAQPLPAKQ
ncbi:MucB/RseB C-terminal domain-containing protein [Pseudomonas sp. RIT-PI-S]|uniref:MucB/RseB C-terminal domain-containing protein n=1 Tax=Pseudomonas sp. RIT-PI-S TaxID=3035295 RepID=UPI0021DACFB0|nr:MucB/RseB C-terminal domain-containing protein [Pseudomonas sp. RIT-PI-S]